MMRHLIIVTWFLLLVGCASSGPQQLHYYFLDNETSSITGSTLSRDPELPLVVIDEVTLAPLLTQPNLLVELDDGELHYALEHVWGEPLVRAIPSVMLKRLRQVNQAYGFESGSEGWFGREQYHIAVNVTTFHPTHDQRAILLGDYRIMTVDGDVVVSEPFELTTQLSSEAHAHAVVKMAALLRQLSEQVSRSLMAL